jgi:hypothetical protein
VFLCISVESRKTERCKGMSLPYTAFREAEEEMLADIPWIVRMFKIQTDDIAVLLVGEKCDIRIGTAESHAALGQEMVVQ